MSALATKLSHEVLHTSASLFTPAPMAHDIPIDTPVLYALARGVFDYRRADPRVRTTDGASLNPYEAGTQEDQMWRQGWEMVRHHRDIPWAVQEMVTIMHRHARLVDENEPIDGPMRLIIDRNEPDC